jgi:hypothetical protein
MEAAQIVWLLYSLTGKPLGAYVHPDELTMEACTKRIATVSDADKKLGDAISTKLGQNIDIDIACVTPQEAAEIVKHMHETSLPPA